MQFLQLDPTGVYVVGYGEARVLPAGAIAISSAMSGAGFLGYYMVDGELKQRPNSPVPIRQAEGWQINASNGATVEVYDLIGGEVMAHEEVQSGGTFEFALPESGRYQVSVAAPLPAFPSKTILEVA